MNKRDAVMVTIDTKELYEILEETPAEQNIMLAGKHGIGKSEIITKFFSEKGLKVVSLFLGQMSDPGDLIGLQKTSADGKTTEFLPPYWFPQDDTPVVLFLDELNRARQEVLQTIMDLALNRTLAGRKLPAGSRVISAVNSGEQYQLTELDPALVSRFNLYDFRPTVKDWLDWAKENSIDERVISFILKNPALLDSDGESEKDFPTLDKTPDRRGWEKVSKIIFGKSEPSRTTCKLMCGIVGVKVGLMFYNSLSKKASVTGRDVLTAFPRVKQQIEYLSLPELCEINKDIFNELNTHNLGENAIKMCSINCTGYFNLLQEKRFSQATEHFILQFSENNFKKANLFIVKYVPDLYNRLSHFIMKL